MQFNQTSSPYNGLIQACETLLDLGIGGISGNTTLLAQFTMLLNVDAYDEVIAEILRNEGSWIWDDFKESNSHLPTATQNLSVVAGAEVNNYALPNGASNSGLGGSDASTFLRLIKVQVMDAAGYYQNLLPIDEGAYLQPLETVFFNPGFPRFYRQMGTSLILYPSPLASEVTATNGLRTEFQRDKVDFTVTGNDSQMPGFASIYHYLLALIASETWAYIKGLKQAQFLTQKKLKFMQNLGWGTANRNKDLRQAITPLQARRNPNYE